MCQGVSHAVLSTHSVITDSYLYFIGKYLQIIITWMILNFKDVIAYREV